LLNHYETCRLYNPIKKSFVQEPDYDYVTWKALRGDATDNIPGIPGCGDKTATKLVKDPQMMTEYLQQKPNRQQIFERNVNLIRLVDFSDNYSDAEIHEGNADWEELSDLLDQMGLDSMLKEKTWNKYVQTFGGL